jgi:hypothetical protein
VELAKQYEEAYSPLSSIEHSDINAFFAMTATMERVGTERRIEIQSDLFVPHYLRNAFQYFAEIFRICNKTITLVGEKELEKTVSEGIKFYADDMLKRGMSPY